MRSLRIRPVVALLVTPPLLVVAPSARSAEEPRDGFDEVVVVATRSPVERDRIGASVSVIDEAQVERSQAAILSDLLVTTPGVAFSRNGGPGTPTAIRIRGAEADQTLVLIDGVQINDPSSTGGGFDFGNLLVGDISRVEIMRGPQSTLYGSQAIGGVINIVTREADDRPSGRFQADYGSRSTSQYKAGVGARYDELTFRLGGARYETDGVSAFDGGSETDPFRNTSFAGRVGYAFSSDLSIDVRAYYADGQSNYDGFPPPFFVLADEGDYTNSRQLITYGGVNFNLFEARLANRVAYQRTEVDRSTYLRAAGALTRTGVYNGENRRFEYQGNFAIAPNYQAVFGFQDEEADMNSLDNPAHAEIGQRSYYLQLQGEIVKGVTLTAGVRNDDHEAFGSHSTTQLAAAWSLSFGTVLRASWGEGFKAPTLYQLYSDYRNPGLQPEESDGFDAGIEQSLQDGRIVLSATYFLRHTTNEISFANCPFPATGGSVCALTGHSSFGYYLNTGRSRATGVELQATFRPIDELEIRANLTDLRVDDRTVGSPTYGQRLLRRPDTLANLEIAYTWPVKLQTSMAARYSSSSFDNDFSTFPETRVALGDYTLVDVRATYPLGERLEITGRVENLFDRTYQTTYQYGTVGRAGYLGVGLRF